MKHRHNRVSAEETYYNHQLFSTVHSGRFIATSSLISTLMYLVHIYQCLVAHPRVNDGVLWTVFVAGHWILQCLLSSLVFVIREVAVFVIREIVGTTGLTFSITSEHL
jgi:hypothetical protein